MAHSQELKWWTSGSGRIELQMTLEQADSGSHPGPCNADVLALSKVPEIAKQLETIDADTLRKELKEYGAWSDTELADRAQNLQRVLWIACADIADENRD